jgi:hypothetical protein
MLREDMTTTALWDKAVAFHGHECPGIAMGVVVSQIVYEQFPTELASYNANLKSARYWITDKNCSQFTTLTSLHHPCVYEHLQQYVTAVRSRRKFTEHTLRMAKHCVSSAVNTYCRRFHLTTNKLA